MIIISNKMKKRQSKVGACFSVESEGFASATFHCARYKLLTPPEN